jgi:hypothetical protein
MSGASTPRFVIMSWPIWSCRTEFWCYVSKRLNVIDLSSVNQICGASFNYSFVPMAGTKGSILVAWHSAIWSGSQVRHSPHALTVHLSHHASAHTWSPSWMNSWSHAPVLMDPRFYVWISTSSTWPPTKTVRDSTGS